MSSRRDYLWAGAVVLLSLWWLSACSSKPAANQNQTAPVDGSAIVAQTIGHLRVQTYSATVNISKVFQSGLRYDDVLKVYSRQDNQDQYRVLINVKPQGERKGSGVLAEMRNAEIVSGYRLVPDTKEIVPLNPKQRFSHVVFGGLSLQDFQLVQGVSPFTETRVTGREELNGKTCDVLEIVFRDQSQYHRGQLFTTVADRLPVLLRAYNKKGEVIKEIVFDKLERVDNAWVVRQLTIVEKSFSYTSTFNFENVQRNAVLDDSIFTTEFLQKGWQEPAKNRRS